MFVGRERELGLLEEAYASDAFEMAVIYGRRRVGKTALIQRFVKGKLHVVFFTAQQTLAQENLRNLSLAIGQASVGREADAGAEVPREGDATGSCFVYLSFSDALAAVFERARTVRTVLVIDEFPYLAASYGAISSLLQTMIDRQRETSKLMLVLCGSSASFMEHQVLGEKSPLYGRRTMQLKVMPFDVFDASKVLGTDDPVRAVELYALVGGVPQYLEQLDGSRSVEWNVANRLIGTGRFLYAEPENYLLQEVRSPAGYNAVLSAVAQGCVRPREIADRVRMEPAVVSQYLSRMEELGVVRRVTPLPSGGKRQVRYEVSDGLMRFHYRYAVRYETAINTGLVDAVASRIVRGDLSGYEGHVFEDVCRQWLARMMRSGRLNVLPKALGTWWGADRDGRQEEIDVVVTGVDGELLLGECKWNRQAVDASVLGVLRRRAALVEGGAEALLYLFSRSGFEPELEQRAAADSRVRLVTVAEMFDAVMSGE